jgi:hypothetical protein
MAAPLKNELILQLIREEFQKKLNLLESDAKLKLSDPQNNGELLVSAGLKVHHKKSGILYTVSAVSRQEVELTTPEGKEFAVDGVTFEQEYEL